MPGLLVVLFVLVLGSAIVPVVSAGKEVMFVPYGSVTLRDPPSGEPMKPFGIAPDGQGFVYVTDTTSGTVSKWKIENEQCVQSWGSRGSGEGQFISPGEIVRNEWTGEIYVVDQGNLRHQILDPFANKWDMFGYRPEDLYTISGLAVTIDGNMTIVHVTDIVGNKVLRYINGTLDEGFRLKTPPEATLYSPMDVAVDKNKNIYVLNSGRGTVQVYDPEGNLATSWGGIGNGTGQLNWPYSMTIDNQGDLYVSDTHNNRIQKFSPNGTLLASFGGEGSGIGQLSTPAGIAVDSSGIVYVVDSDNSRIVMFKKQGSADPMMIPGGVGVPVDRDSDGTIDDVNGNGRRDFADVVLYFNQMTWIAANEPLSLFDINQNGRIDFADVVALFNKL